MRVHFCLALLNRLCSAEQVELLGDRQTVACQGSTMGSAVPETDGRCFGASLGVASFTWGIGM
jgi:hypothetical protein